MIPPKFAEFSPNGMLHVSILYFACCLLKSNSSESFFKDGPTAASVWFILYLFALKILVTSGIGTRIFKVEGKDADL